MFSRIIYISELASFCCAADHTVEPIQITATLVFISTQREAYILSFANRIIKKTRTKRNEYTKMTCRTLSSIQKFYL